MRYCVNLDWVELHCEFDSLLCRTQFGTFQDHSTHGFAVRLREYGTRVYKHVSEIRYLGVPFATLCYHPLSSMDAGGIMRPTMCHIKLDNYWCYRDDWNEVLSHALRIFRIKPVGLTRLDIACDVQWFACGMYAADLAAGLIKRKYYKIHQSSWGAHGTDADKLSWNSLSFGSKSSPVFTRFYNKSKELEQVKDKQYIRECWNAVGFKPDRDVWRIEFALTDTGKRSIDTETGEVFDVPLSDIVDRRKVQDMFIRYASHYFDIRKNTGQRRYECPRLELLPPSPKRFVPFQRPHLHSFERTDRLVLRRMIDQAAALPNRGERMAMLQAAKLYQSAKRVEMMSERDWEKLSVWLYNLETDDVDKELQLSLFDDAECTSYIPYKP